MPQLIKDWAYAHETATRAKDDIPSRGKVMWEMAPAPSKHVVGQDHASLSVLCQTLRQCYTDAASVSLSVMDLDCSIGEGLQYITTTSQNVAPVFGKTFQRLFGLGLLGSFAEVQCQLKGFTIALFQLQAMHQVEGIVGTAGLQLKSSPAKQNVVAVQGTMLEH